MRDKSHWRWNNRENPPSTNWNPLKFQKKEESTAENAKEIEPLRTWSVQFIQILFSGLCLFSVGLCPCFPYYGSIWKIHGKICVLRRNILQIACHTRNFALHTILHLHLLCIAYNFTYLHFTFTFTLHCIQFYIFLCLWPKLTSSAILDVKTIIYIYILYLHFTFTFYIYILHLHLHANSHLK